MTVESVTFINTLDHNRPQGGDSIAQGDDHIRNIKKAIKQTFPNIDGEVLASQEELNHLVGNTKPISEIGDQIQAIDDQINLDGGLADKVDDHEQAIQEGAQAIQDNADAIANQKLGDHADVDLTGLQAGMVVVWDGTNWVPQKMTSGGGGMIKMVQQPSRAGDFQYNGSNQSYHCAVPPDATTTRTLTVPNGMVFCLDYIYGVHSNAIGGSSISVDGIRIDGDPVAPANSGGMNYDTNGGPAWPSGLEKTRYPESVGSDRSASIRVEESLSVAMQSSVYEGRIWIAGVFVEA